MAHETMIPCTKAIRNKIKEICIKHEWTYNDYLEQSIKLMEI